MPNVPGIKRAPTDALLAEIVASSDDAIASKTLEGIVTSWNRAAERLFGYTAEEMIGQPIALLAAPGREDEMPAILARVRRGERIDHLETVRRRKDGGLVEVALTVSPVHDRRGRIVGASKIARDIGPRRALEERQRLLLGELQHRVKNLLALVQALARQTEAAGRSGEVYRDAFLGRLETLARAHELAFDADATAHLGELVAGTLAPYHAAGPARLAVEDGPSVVLARGQITPLCLILHELATNAVKHGALSAPAGQVRVGWQDQPGQAGGGGRRLRLRWEEQGGPETRPPSGRGFGTRLMEFAATHELHGQAELTFAPEGLQAEIAFPHRLGPVSWGSTSCRLARRRDRAATTGRLVLVVEDEFLIAMHLELLLQQHGWRVLGPAATVAEALRLLQAETPDVALLDLNLRGELVTPVAEELQARGVPFVVASAYGRAGQMVAAVNGAPVVSKPIDERRLMAVLAQAVPRR